MCFTNFELKATMFASLTNISNCMFRTQHRPHAERRKERIIQHLQWISVKHFLYYLNQQQGRFSAIILQAVLIMPRGISFA